MNQSLCVPSPMTPMTPMTPMSLMSTEPMSMPSSPFRSFNKSFESGFMKKDLKTFSQRDLSAIGIQEDGSTSHSAKKCREPNWHSRVWLQTSSNIQLLHLCHVCKLSCQRNYRSDISKQFGSRSKSTASTNASIIWYRYFAR